MKNLIISFLILIPLQIVSGQDKIITIQHDTIFCRIVSVSSTHIQYEQKDENQDIVGKFLPTEQILEYYRNSQSSDINSDRQMPKPVNKHYFGFNITPGIGKYIGRYSSTWDENYFGVGVEYTNRLDNTEVGAGLIISNETSISVPFTAKKYLGEYIFIGISMMAGYDLKEESLCIGTVFMIGLEYVFENGFSLSLTPNLRYSLTNLTGNKDNPNSQGVIVDTSIKTLQHVGATIGIGYRF